MACSTFPVFSVAVIPDEPHAAIVRLALTRTPAITGRLRNRLEPSGDLRSEAVIGLRIDVIWSAFVDWDSYRMTYASFSMAMEAFVVGCVPPIGGARPTPR